MGQVLTTPYMWGLRLHIFWDTHTDTQTHGQAGFLFKMDSFHNESVVKNQQRRFGSVRDQDYFFLKPNSS